MFDVNDVVAHAVEEGPIVRDHEQGSSKALQPGFQPDRGLQVQVVGRLVQKQQIGRSHQRLGQIQADPHAAGESSKRLLDLIGGKAEPVQDSPGAGPCLVPADVAEARM